MAQALELYEQKILKDEEFPIQLSMDRAWKKGRYFSLHWHEHIELHYVVSGKTAIKLDQEEFAARKGDLVVVNSNVLHEGFCDGTLMEALVVIFEMEDFSKELADKSIIFHPLIEQDKEIGRIMLRLYEENKRRQLGYRLACKGALLELITYLIRHYAQETLSDSDSMRRRKKLERLNTVLQYIDGHYTEPLNNRELADLIHLSEDRFNHLFKESMGMAPLQYINEMRLKKAMRLLKNGELLAVEVAAAVGFSDYNNFGRMFRRYYGCTPMEIRENSRIV